MARLSIVLGTLLLFLLSGCGLGVLQTARPVQRGVFEFHGGTGIIANDVLPERTGSSVYWSFVEFGARLGVTDHLDVGFKGHMFPGGQVDTRYNFLAPSTPLAISVAGGIGGSGGTTGGSLHIPVSLGLSYDFPIITPYIHVGWLHFWLWPFERGDEDDVDYIEAKGHGDGVLRSTAGLRFRFNKFVQLYVEYNHWLPLLNDLGDRYRFDTTHVVLIGLGILTGNPIF